MAYQIRLGTIDKKENSTKQPSYTTWAAYDIVFKDGADINNPVITLKADLDDILPYNYAVLLNRFYWIRNKKVLRTDYCILSLEIDVLATYREEIGNSSLYILRSSAESNGAINDTYYPPLASYSSSLTLQDADTVPQPNFNTGYFIISAMGTGGSLGGAEILYLVNPTNFKLIVNGLYTAIDGVQLSDAVNWVYQKLGGNPQELISSVIWVPYALPAGNSTWVYVGAYQTQGTGMPITRNKVDLARYVYTIPKHPLAASRGSYLNCNPYSNYMLYIPGSGIIQLDSTKLINEDTIIVDRTMDIKGQLLTTVRTGNYIHSKTFSQIGVPISLNGNNSGESIISGITSTAVAAASAIITGGAGAVLGAVGSGVETIAGAMGGASSNTASGSIAGIGDYGALYCTFYNIPPEDNARNGRPLCAIRQPKNIPGFMIAQKGEVEIPGTLEEESRITSFLESGFYYE